MGCGADGSVSGSAGVNRFSGTARLDGDRLTLGPLRTTRMAGSPEAMEDPWAFPGGHDLSGMPPTLVLDADRDSLRASGDAFVAELGKAGVDVTNEIVPESAHGFLDRPGTPAFERGIGRAIRWLDRH